MTRRSPVQRRPVTDAEFRLIPNRFRFFLARARRIDKYSNPSLTTPGYPRDAITSGWAS